MNQVSIFKFEDAPVRTVLIDDEPWLVGKDVAEILGYENPTKAVKDHVDPEDRKMGVQNVTPSIIDSLGRKQYPTLINESGVYSLVFGSKVSKAKEFKRWVTSDVLPSIRKTGKYSAPMKELDSYMIEDRIERAKKWIEEEQVRINLESDNKKLLETQKEMKPKTEFFDQMVAGEDMVNFRDFAKEMGVKEKDLMTFLLNGGYIYKNKNGRIRPKAGKGDGLFALKYFTNTKNHFRGQCTFITPHGRLMLAQELKKIGLMNSVTQSSDQHEAFKKKRKGKCRPIVCIETNKTFASLKEASASIQVAPPTLCMAIRQNRPCKGNRFSYMDDVNNAA